MTQEPYSEQVLDHFARPRNLGRLPDATGRGTVGDLREGPVQITIAVRVERDDAGEERVAAARFRTFGCSAAIAASSMATVLIAGRPAREAAALTPEAILAALGGLPDDRRYAPEMAAAAVQAALADHARAGETENDGRPPEGATGGDMGRDYARTVKPGHKVALHKFDADDTGGLTKADGEQRMQELDRELSELQELLYAAGQHSVLLLLQGLDTSGKDGTVKRVLKEVNPAGCHIVAFKAPSPHELAHDYLWRVHANVPAKGLLGVFNRSHYEDVLIVRVHNLVPEAVWRKRYAQINAFEQLLTDTGTILVKCYLHISKEEQEERLLAREQDVTKAWKLSPQDWVERRSWDDYTAAYNDALTECNTATAPWHIIPANKKWFRNVAIAQLLVEAMRPHKRGWLDRLETMGQDALREIAAARAIGQMSE